MRLLRSFLASALFVVIAPAGCTFDQGTDSGSLSGAEQNDNDCTLTQGYWKNHPEAWPVASLQLGATVYVQADLLGIFHEPVAGNGLISLSHQLIAAKLNVAAGANSAGVAATIAAADALIGSLVTPPVGGGYLHPSVTSALNDLLDAFNNSGAGSCGEAPACGDGTLDAGELCDDGNTANGDGCSATCTIEAPAPVCGDGTLNAGELCDDGNTANGDGCSATCTIEVPAAVCGNGVIEPGEQCDDGNGNDHDTCTNTCHVGT